MPNYFLDPDAPTLLPAVSIDSQGIAQIDQAIYIAANDAGKAALIAEADRVQRDHVQREHAKAEALREQRARLATIIRPAMPRGSRERIAVELTAAGTALLRAADEFRHADNAPVSAEVDRADAPVSVG